MATVQLTELTKVYAGHRRAVDRLDLTIRDRELLVLVGPSGCGKTTTLRLVAGLEEPTAGTVRIDERVVNGVPPKERDVAMVFQTGALYPHLTVARNLAFGLELRRRSAGWGRFAVWERARRGEQVRIERAAIAHRVREAAETLGLVGLLQRRPRELSGGEQQRVAIGRAVVRRPRVFLFDEPLSNLDAPLRGGLRAELKQLQRRSGTTTLYVTHDQEEALILGDRVAVMNAGVVHQCGTPTQVYDQPADRFVAGFVGHPPMNFLEGRLAAVAGRLVFDDGAHRWPVAAEHADRLASAVDQPMVLGLRPEAIHLLEGPAVPREAALPGRVTAVELLGDRTNVYCDVGPAARLVCRTTARPPFTAGATVRMRVDLARAHYFGPGPVGRNRLVD